MEDRAISLAHSIIGVSHGRPEHDFYPTPSFATISLLQKEKFEGLIWEPACGDGAISKVLEEKGYTVWSTDLYDYGYGNVGVDFLHSYKKVSNIITNPPYKLAQAFVEHALECTERKVAMLLKLQFLEGVGRYKFFKSSPLKNVYVFSKRLSMNRNGIKMKNKGMICFAWFVWEHGYKGQPIINWIL